MTNKLPRPVRVQRSRKRGFRLQDASPNGLPVVYVGRPTKWGNVVPTDRLGLMAYETWVKWMVSKGNLDLNKLRSKNLACWCSLDQPCHADILLRMANR